MKRVKLYLYLIAELVVLGIALTFARLLARLLVVQIAPQVVVILVALIVVPIAPQIARSIVITPVLTDVAELAEDVVELVAEPVVVLVVDVRGVLDAVVAQEHAQQDVKNLVGSASALAETYVQAAMAVQDAEDHVVDHAVAVAQGAVDAVAPAPQVVLPLVLQVVKLVAGKDVSFSAHRNAQLIVKTAAQAIA